MAIETTRFRDFSDRPMMLKDFLTQDYTCTPSCKSTEPVALLRSWSKKAATKISAVRKAINAFKLLQSHSRKSGKTKDIFSATTEDRVKVKVKDILRLRSFTDTAADESTPLDSSTTASSFSWCDSDYAAEDLPLWGGENEALLKSKTKVDWLIGECEQQSPVSVLDMSPFHPSLPNFETTRIREMESTCVKKHGFVAFSKEASAIEEKAKWLLSQLERESDDDMNMMLSIYDFFRCELSINGKFDDFEFEDEILRVAKSWCNGGVDDESYDWDVEGKRKAYVRDMERGVCWNKFGEEQEEVSLELEVEVLNELIDEVLVDFRC